MMSERASERGRASRRLPGSGAAMGVWAALSLLACGDAPTPAPGVRPPTSADHGAQSQATSASPSPSAPHPSSPGAPPASLRELLAGGPALDALPLEDSTPGRQFDAMLERALAAGGHVEIASGSHELLAKAAQASLAEFRVCYGRGLALNPTLRGTIRVQTATRSERPAPPARVSGDLPDPQVLECMLAELHRALGWEPPEPSQPAAPPDENAPRLALVLRDARD